MTLFEATSGQHGIWFTERAGVARTAYHMALAVRLVGELDLAALTRACEAVIGRHEPLRTALTEVDGTLCAVPAAEVPPVRQVSYHPDLVRDEVTRPFDLERGPLARFVIAAESPERHLLLFVAHHLVFDGMSKDVLVRELATAYAGAPLPPLATSYGEYAAAERDLLAADLPAAREFWRDRWREPDEPVLPGLRRSPVAAEPGEVHEFSLDPGLTGGLARTAEALGVTRFELFLAALHVLLHRYGNRDLPVAVDMSTRTETFADHIGLFVNELPVAPPPFDDVTFREYALRVRGRLREIYRFRCVPVGHAVGSLRPRAAICPVSLSYRRRAAEEAKFSRLDAEVEWMVFHHSARNALHLQLVESTTGVDVGLQYAPAAIDADSVRRIAGHLVTVLESVVADPDRRIDELPVLPAEEREWLARVGDGGPAYPPDLTVVDGFAAQVAATPYAVAVVAGGRTVTYRELDAAVARLAGRLREQGVNPGDLVALCLGRSLETLVAALAVGRIGAAYLPLDPAHPARRRHAILSEAAPVLLLTRSDKLAEAMPAPTLALDDALAATGTSEPVEVVLPVDPDSTAYVIYTSGSTGRPKGVTVPHRALANLLQAMGEAVGAGPADRWLSLAAPSFDMSVPELYLPLMVGARTVIVPDDLVRDGAALLRLIREQQITHMQATPSAWRLLLDSGFGTGPEAGRLVAVAGAEALPVPLAQELRGRVRRLFNVYGPTEVTVWATVTELPATVTEVTIGSPMPGTRAYVLDERLAPVPVGVAGELYLGGAQVADGYFGRPELTEERFVADPFGPGRLYRTGDLCRWSPEGRLVFLGRVDDQVKLRGHRIELGEVTAALLACDGVRQAAAALRGSGEEARLVGYVVPDGDAPDGEALRARLGELLPAVMVPSAFVILDRLPLTPNGKLDRAALPEPPPRPVVVPAAPAAPTDPVLEQVRAIWQDVLRIDRVEADDDLFDLGGHSLTITRISARIQQLLGVTVPLDVFYDTPTLGEVAEAVRGLVAAR